MTTVVSEHDEQQGAVQLVVEHALGEPDAGEDQADLAARDHADADEQAVGRVPPVPYADTSLPATAMTNRIDGVEQHAGWNIAPRSALTPISTKKTGISTPPTLFEVAGDALVVLAAADGEPGHERADDERQLGGVGEHGEAEDDARARRR